MNPDVTREAVLPWFEAESPTGPWTLQTYAMGAVGNRRGSPCDFASAV